MKKSTQDSRVSYYKKPSDLSSEQYQIKLRLQFGEDHSFVIQNVGSQEIFSSYAQGNLERYAAPGPLIRMWGLLLLIAMGLTNLVAKQGVKGAVLQLKAWCQAALHWFA